jgi:hypothetical protein
VNLWLLVGIGALVLVASPANRRTANERG